MTREQISMQLHIFPATSQGNNPEGKYYCKSDWFHFYTDYKLMLSCSDASMYSSVLAKHKNPHPAL